MALILPYVLVTGLFTYKSRRSENNVTLFFSGFREATIIESVRNHHWCLAHPYQSNNTLMLPYWSVFIGVQTVLDTDDITVCFILSNTHLNHEIAETDKKKIIKIQINIKNPFNIHLDFFVWLFLVFRELYQIYGIKITRFS